MNTNKFESVYQPVNASGSADKPQEEILPDQTRKPENIKGQERIEDNIWRPGIFDEYSADMAAGASTKKLRHDDKNSLRVFVSTKPKDFTEEDLRKARYRAGRIMRDLRNVLSPETDLHHIVKTKLGANTGNVKKIDEAFAGGLTSGNLKNMEIEKTDGMITNLPGYPLFVSAADCHPVGIYDPEHKAIGAFHTGLREFLEGITDNGLEAMAKEYGTDPSKIKVVIAPGIGDQYLLHRNDYKDNLKKFPDFDWEKYTYEVADPKRIGIYLETAIRDSLLKHGVAAENIESSEYNTVKDNDLFPSNRVEGGTKRDNYGFMISLK